MLKVINNDLIKITTEGNFIVKIRTTYAIIEKLCSTRDEAVRYLNNITSDHEVKGYYIGPQIA